MKVAGLVLGILGGLSGIGSALMKFAIGGAGVALGEPVAGGTFFALAVVTGLFSLVGLIMACMTNSRPALSGFTQLVATVLCVVTVSWITFFFFLLGGIFALVGWRQDVALAAASATPQPVAPPADSV